MTDIKFDTEASTGSTGSTGSSDGPTNTDLQMNTEERNEIQTPISNLWDNPLVKSVVGTVKPYMDTQIVNDAVSGIGKQVGGLFEGFSNHPFLQNDRNRGWIMIGGAVLSAMLLISIIWQFIFYFMVSYASAKVALWFLEHYEPADSNEVVGTEYVSESNPVDVIEYIVVLIFVAALTPLSYLPLPFWSLIVNLTCVLMSIGTLASKAWRRKVCMFLKNRLVSEDYEPGKGTEGKIHSSLQTFCFTVESLNVGAFNMARNTRGVLNDVGGASSFTEGFKRFTAKALKSIADAKNRAQKKTIQDEEESQEESQEENNEDSNEDTDEGSNEGEDSVDDLDEDY